MRQTLFRTEPAAENLRSAPLREVTEMIYTVTFNPALDYVVHTDTMRVGEVNRSRKEEIYFGGKGINVSAVLNELGVKSKALGFTAGFTGEAIENSLNASGIEADFIRLGSGFSRINVKIKSAGGADRGGCSETEINGRGPDIPKEKADELFVKLNAVGDGDTIILAGSIPPSLPSDIYEKILAHLSGRKVRAVVDATGDLLMNVLKYKPFLIKPNNIELGEIFGVRLDTADLIIEYAGKLRRLGAENVLVSRAGDGAVLLDGNGRAHTCGVCKGEVKNSVGAGDSMVAGFVAGIEKGDYEYALKLGTAAGGATAFSEGLAKKDDIYRLLGQLEQR